jgi:hypothetical protein
MAFHVAMKSGQLLHSHLFSTEIVVVGSEGPTRPPHPFGLYATSPFRGLYIRDFSFDNAQGAVDCEGRTALFPVASEDAHNSVCGWFDLWLTAPKILTHYG